MGFENHGPNTVSVSDILAGTKCRRKQWLRRRGVKPRIPVLDAPSVRGDVVHAGMAAAFLSDTVDQHVLNAACAAKFRELGGTAASPLEEFHEWCQITGRAARAFPISAWTPVVIAGDRGEPVPLVEQRLFVPLRDPGLGKRMHCSIESYEREHGSTAREPVFSFKPDAVLINKQDGKIWICDHKTRASLGRYYEWTEEHIQALTYWRCLAPRMPIAGSFLYQILAAVPKRPRINKPKKGQTKGKVRSGPCVTDWETAKLSIMESINPNPDDPEYMELKLQCQMRVWQYPQRVEATRASLEGALRHIQREFAAGAAIGENRPTGRGHACDGCEFAQWCARDFMGENPESLLGELYVDPDHPGMSPHPADLGRAPVGPQDPSIAGVGGAPVPDDGWNAVRLEIAQADAQRAQAEAEQAQAQESES